MNTDIKKIKVLINNVVPLNNGDVALFSSLYKKLITDGYSVKIATYYYKEASRKYPQFPFVKDLGQSKIFVKLPFLKQYVLPFLYLLSKAYRDADVIIGAPGGYINSNYAIRNNIFIFRIAKYFGKTTGIYSQSVGPLTKKDAVYFKNLMHQSIDYLFVRDTYSFNLLKHIKVDSTKFKQTKDAAFLLGFKEIDTSVSTKVAISVRYWNYDNRSMKVYITMLSKLTMMVIDSGYEVDFLSTCQGLKSYKNDAIVAKEIVDNLDEKYQNKINVLTDYFTFDQLYAKIEAYNFVIGTRLHMCILALTKNVPAFNISYEIKGKECYSYLGLLDYSIDFNETIENATVVFGDFIEEKESLRKKLKPLITKASLEAVEDYNVFMNKLLAV